LALTAAGADPPASFRAKPINSILQPTFLHEVSP
jgi:hypothetical protein